MTSLPLFAHARRSDPETSHSAAKSVGKVEELRQTIVRLFRYYGPMTDLQLVERYEYDRGTNEYVAIPRVTPQNLRSRRAELCKGEKPLVHDTLKRELGPSGRPFVVWGLTNKEG